VWRARVRRCGFTYDLNEEGKIERGRVYVLVNTFLEQVGASRSSQAGAVKA
jgi:hypothetical protein